MIIPETLKKELNNGLFLECKLILIYPRCLEALASITINSEVPFFGLLKRTCAWSPEDLEVNMFKVIKGLFIKKEHFPIEVSLKG